MEGIVVVSKIPSHFDDDYILSQEKIEKYLPIYKSHQNLSSVIQGFSFENDDVYFIYPTLKSIKLETDEIFVSPMGGTFQITSLGTFELIKRDKDLNESIIEEKTQSITSVLKCTDKFVTLKKENHSEYCEIQPNVGLDNRTVTITSSYAFQGKFKSCTLQMVQEANKVSEWLLESIVTDDLSISLNPPIISTQGGKSIVDVKRKFTKYLYKKDLCGNVMDRKVVHDNFDDVSKLCRYQISNPSIFKRMGNTITVEPQEINAPSRSCDICVSYDGFEAMTTLEQSKGGQLSYKYILTFNDDSDYLEYKFNTSRTCSIQIPLISIQQQLIDDELKGTLPNLELGVKDNGNWFRSSIDEIDDNIVLTVKVIEPNNSKVNENIGSITIYPRNDYSNQITLSLVQPQNKPIRDDFTVFVEGNDEFTIYDVEKARITFKTLKTVYYESGDKEEELFLPQNMKLECFGHSTNEDVLSLGVLKQTDFNGTHVMKPKYGRYGVDYDVFVNASVRVVDKTNSEKAYQPTYFTFGLQKQDLVTHNYEFKFGDNTRYKELIWKSNDTKEISLPFVNNTSTFVNGILSETFNSNDLVIKALDNKSCSNFSLFVRGDKIVVNPKFNNITKEPIIGDFEISGKEGITNPISLRCVQEGLNDDIEIDLIVKAVKLNNDILDCYSNDNASLVVYNKTDNIFFSEIPLQRLWLFKDIENNEDIIYDGKIFLRKNKEFTFKIKNLNILNYNNKNNIIKEIEYNKNIFINDKTKNILLKIEF